MSSHQSLQHLLDATVFDLNGVRSGRLSDVLVDPRDGRVAFARIALDGSAFGAWRYVVVPWSTLELEQRPGDEVQAGCRVKVRRETLERLARFEMPAAGPARPDGYDH